MGICLNPNLVPGGRHEFLWNTSVLIWFESPIFFSILHINTVNDVRIGRFGIRSKWSRFIGVRLLVVVENNFGTTLSTYCHLFN